MSDAKNDRQEGLKPPSPQAANTTADLNQAGKPVPAEKKKAGFWQRIARWALVFLIVFFLGFLAAVFSLYNPVQQSANNTRATLQAASARASEADRQYQQKIADLEKQVANMQPVKEENKDLQGQLDRANLHMAILSVRVDVSAAQLALAQNDVALAKESLTKTSDTLIKISDLAGSEQREAVAKLSERLALALKELDTDRDLANSDLGVLENSLLKLENALFTER